MGQFENDCRNPVKTNSPITYELTTKYCVIGMYGVRMFITADIIVQND